MRKVAYPDMILRSNDYYYDKKTNEYLEISSYGVLRGDFDRAIKHVIRRYNWFHYRCEDRDHMENDFHECKCFVARYIDDFEYNHNGKPRSAFSYVSYLARCFFKKKLDDLKSDEYKYSWITSYERQEDAEQKYIKITNDHIKGHLEYNTDFDNDIHNERMEVLLKYYLDKLDDESKFIINKRYGFGCESLSAREIGKIMNCSFQSIYNKEKRIIKRLRKQFASKLQEIVVDGLTPIGDCM